MLTSPSIPGHFWWQLLGTLALQTFVALALAFALQRQIRSASWRRTIWRIALLAVAALVICESAGLGPTITRWTRRQFVAPPAESVARAADEIEPPISLLFPSSAPFVPEPGRAVPVLLQVPAASPEENSMWWPGLLWLCGMAIVLVRVALSHAWLAFVWEREAVRDERLLERVRRLAQRVGVRRRIWVVESPRLSGPMTFGLFRPVIGLPSDFTRNFNPAQQEAMLAHELAHVAARDPLWLAFADGVCALLWWQPLAWWARRHFRAASEDAADEASLLVENGPEVLAECLVKLGGRLARGQSPAGLGIEGGEYRSGLGRRVKRLLGLSGRHGHPLRRTYVLAAKTFGPIALVAIVLLATAWTYPTPATVVTFRAAFQQSALGVVLAVALPADRGAKETVTTASPPPSSDRIDWKPWSRAAVDQARGEGKPVLVEFTADWCVAAKVNEKTSLEIDLVRAKLRELGVVPLRADNTVENAEITAELRRFDRVGVPLVLIYSATPAVSPKVLPEVLTPGLVLDALAEATSPVMATPTPKPEAVEPEDPKNNAPQLILSGKALMEAGRFAEAEAKLREALQLDPASNAAKQYLAQLQVQREQAGESAKASLAQAAINAPSATNAVFINAGRRRIMQKLDTIRLDKVSFDGIPLSKAIESLAQRVWEMDSERRRINFVVPGEPGEPGIVVQIQPPLRDVTLREALDAIVRGAEQPIRYSIEDYGIVFSLGSVAPPPLYTRWFKIDPRTFHAGIREMLGANTNKAILDPTLQAPLAPIELFPVKRANDLDVLPPRRAAGVARATSVPTPAEELLEDARALFSRVGVDLTQPGKQIIYGDRLGMLMVRATLPDLDLIEQTIQVLNTPPPQVVIEVKFCEIDEADGKALGFDWLLTGTRTNRLSDARTPTRTNPAVEMVTGILTDPQFRVVLRALQQRRGVSVLSAPKVTTLSGRQAQIKSVEVRYIVTGLETTGPADPLGPGSSTKPQSTFLTESFELGPVIDVVPYVQADGVTISMTVIPSIKEFVGYDLESEKQIRKLHNSGDPKSRPTAPAETSIPLPIFRLRQIVASAVVWDGQTLVLSGGSMTYEQNGKTLPADSGAQKGASRLFGGQKAVNRKKTLLVFVTPTLIDPAGNRVHSDEKIAFTKDSIPPQKPGAPSK